MNETNVHAKIDINGNFTTAGGMFITKADLTNTDAYFGLGNDADYGQIGANEIGLWNVNNNDIIFGTNNALRMTIANALTTFTTDLKISDDLYFNGGSDSAWIIGKTSGSGYLRIQNFAQFKVDGNISTKESLSIGADSWVGHAQIQLWDDRKEETSMPLVSEIAFYESNMADSATAVLEVEAGYVYTNGFVDVRINGESGNGTQTHYYGTHSFGFHPSGCSFGDVGTPVESASDTVSFAYQSSAKFRISVKCQADDTRLAFYFKVYGFGADQGGNTYNGCTITRLID